MTPVVVEHCGIKVVRDDLYPGGTKARAFEYLYSKYEDVVYCCSATSCTQVSLATAAKGSGKKATIFTAKRGELTKQTARAMELGADVHQVSPGYLSVARARGKEYADSRGSTLLAALGFDLEEVISKLVEAARQAPVEPEEVWCAAGSGVLTRSLQRAWPQARHCAVQVGKECDVGRAELFVSPLDFEREWKGRLEFPSERHFDAKAWAMCKEECSSGVEVLFWNVMGDL